MQFEEIKSLIEQKFPDAILSEDHESTPNALIISTEYIHQVCDLLHANEMTYFDSLSCLTGLDNGEEQNTMEVIYNLSCST